MSVFGRTAIQAVELLKEGKCSSPSEAWYQAIIQYTKSLYMQNKPCPRDTFLALCQKGLIVGLKIKPEHFTNSVENKGYALEAVDILRHDSSEKYNRSTLWNEVMRRKNKNISHNNQMDVVYSLWKQGYIE